jgi:hypothetical protein
MTEINEINKMNDSYSRQNKWIQASLKIGKIEVFMIPFTQMLGRLDQKLIQVDEKISQLNYKGSPTNILEFDEHYSFSHLWVLGCYEITKAIYERCRIDNRKPKFSTYPKFSTDAINQKARETKILLERIRVPLAKFESSEKNPFDSHIAIPINILNVGVGWKLSDDYIISRKQLSDAFLDFIVIISDEKSLSIR